MVKKKKRINLGNFPVRKWRIGDQIGNWSVRSLVYRFYFPHIRLMKVRNNRKNHQDEFIFCTPISLV